MCDVYSIKDNSFNYYHYQPGSNNIKVYSKHVTHARTYARTHARTHERTHARTHARTHERTHAHTHTHTYTHAHTPTRPPTAGTVQVVAVRWVGVRPSMTKLTPPFSPFPLAMNGRSVLHSNKQSCVRRDIRDSFGCFSRIIKLLGRTETRTCDSMCVQTIRTV